MEIKILKVLFDYLRCNDTVYKYRIHLEVNMDANYCQLEIAVQLVNMSLLNYFYFHNRFLLKKK